MKAPFKMPSGLKCHLNNAKIAVFFFSNKMLELSKGLRDFFSNTKGLWASPQAPLVVTCSLAHNLHNQQLSKSLLQGF